MSSDTFVYAVSVIGIIIAVLCLALLVLQGGKKRATKKDTFRSKKEIGAENVGEFTRDISYKELAKIRNLPEAKKLKRRPNPDVTKHISATAALVREHRREDEEEHN